MLRAVELALGAAAAALLVLLVVPWKAAPLPGATGSSSSPHPELTAARHETRSTVPPDVILRLFTGGGPAAPASAASPAAKAVDAPWLRYMGRSSAPDGTTHVYVKDTKSGKVIRATRGAALDGWILVSEDAAGLTLRHGDDLYTVSRQ